MEEEEEAEREEEEAERLKKRSPEGEDDNKQDGERRGKGGIEVGEKNKISHMGTQPH